MTLLSVVAYRNTKYVASVHNGRLPGKQSLLIQYFNVQKAVKCSHPNIQFLLCEPSVKYALA